MKRLVVVSLTMLLLAIQACSDSDVVDGPFFREASLTEIPCDEPAEDRLCFRVRAAVSGIGGPATGDCEVVALATDHASTIGSPSKVRGVVMVPGQHSVFDVSVVDVSDSDGFLRWQSTCSPGPPG